MPPAFHDELVRLRRELHRTPEIGLELPRTQQIVLRELEGLPLEITLGRGSTSITAVLRGGAARDPRPAVLLRADMDALPVQEQPGLDYASEIDGAMHACGHDLHTAMLVGAARLLSERRESLPGDVVFMFQPGEEGWDGAAVMIEEGVLEASGRLVDAAYGMHVFAGLEEHGVFSSRDGVMLAAADGLFATIHGAGGHGSAPHLAKDPVVAAAEAVTALQTAVTRRFDAFDPVVVSVGVLQAGTKRNVIPDRAAFEATVRSFSPEARAAAGEILPAVIDGIARAHGVRAEVEYAAEYPPTINDAAEVAFAEGVARELFGEARFTRMAKPLGGSEDFSRVLEAVPGAFLALSATSPGIRPADAAFNHSPLAVFDDGILADGARLHAELATRKLTLLQHHLTEES